MPRLYKGLCMAVFHSRHAYASHPNAKSDTDDPDFAKSHQWKEINKDHKTQSVMGVMKLQLCALLLLMTCYQGNVHMSR
jgi:hypothetical protein